MLSVDINCSVSNSQIPDNNDLVLWAKSAYLAADNAELALTIMDGKQIAQLNQQFRGKNKETNVLSFPADSLPVDNLIHLGDIVLCDTVITEEAAQQNKSISAHWAHMVVHGMLHLQCYDHETDSDAKTMEALEIQILGNLGFSNPYIIKPFASEANL